MTEVQLIYPTKSTEFYYKCGESFYDIKKEFYQASPLSGFTINLQKTQAEFLRKLNYTIKNIQSQTTVQNLINHLLSQPLFLNLLPKGSQYPYTKAIATTDSNILRLLVFENPEQQIDNYWVVEDFLMNVPEPFQSCGESLLALNNLPEFNPGIRSRLVRRSKLSQVGIPIQVININTLRSASLQVPIIPFDEAGSMLLEGKIHRYVVDPEFQHYTQNTIITLFGTNGRTYLVNARYDPQTSMIYPPV